MKTKKTKIKQNFFIENKRVTFIIICTLLTFIIILLRILYLNIYMGSYYKMKLNNEKETYIYGNTSPRGQILDRNGKILVGNKAVKSIYYKKEKNITQEKEIQTAYKMSKIININYKNLKERNQREFYILINKEKTDKLITQEEYQKEKNRKLSENDIYELKIKRIKKEDLKKMTKQDKKAAYLYYLMNKGYYYDEKLIKENVTNKEYAYYSENKNLNGFYAKLKWERIYPYKDTLRSILGNISNEETGLPSEETEKYLKKGYTLNDRVGISGLEKQYEDILKGEKEVYKLGEGNEKILVQEGKKGNDIVLSIDIDLQKKIDKILEKELINAKNEANTHYFNSAYLIIQNPTNGEIMSISGKKLINKKGTYKTLDFPEGAMLSTITPGSVVKGASIMVGYTQKAIEIGTVMQDSCIGLYNLPEKCSWKTLGYINDLQALQYSSNVYQYKIAMKVGGFNYAYGKKLKIKKEAFNTYRNMFYRFGLGVKTGIDYPKEEDGYKSDNKAGDLLINYAIGQYDTYTPMQLSQYISTIANKGTRIKPRFLKAVQNNGKIIYKVKKQELNKLQVPKKYINRVRQGLRLVMTSGTGVGYMDSAPYPSGKTGTSESFLDTDNDGVIDKATISNNFVGYAPSKNPVMSITGAFPDIQYPASAKYKTNANQRIISKSTKAFFDIYNKDKNKKKTKIKTTKTN